MNKREKELEDRVRQLEDVCSDLLNVLDHPVSIAEDMDWVREAIEDAKAVWLREGEIEDDYNWREG